MKIISEELIISDIQNIAPSIREIGQIAFQDKDGIIYHIKGDDIIKLYNYYTTINATTNNIIQEPEPTDINKYFD